MTDSAEGEMSILPNIYVVFLPGQMVVTSAQPLTIPNTHGCLSLSLHVHSDVSFYVLKCIQFCGLHISPNTSGADLQVCSPRIRLLLYETTKRSFDYLHTLLRSLEVLR